jgi:hypothetical protein
MSHQPTALASLCNISKYHRCEPSSLSGGGQLDGTCTPNAGAPAEATLALDMSDKAAPWTATLTPANRTTGWLTITRQSGIGPGQITLTATGAGYAPGAYRAVLLIQSESANPQYLTVPIMYVLGGSTSGTTVAAVANAISYQTSASPGMLLSVFGANLANTTATARKALEGKWTLLVLSVAAPDGKRATPQASGDLTVDAWGAETGTVFAAGKARRPVAARSKVAALSGCRAMSASRCNVTAATGSGNVTVTGKAAAMSRVCTASSKIREGR